MFDISAIGELLIDFTLSGKSKQGHPLYECNPGGAPANVLAAVSKLGMNTAFLGKVGNDEFGNFLKTTLSKLNISTNGIIKTDEYNTTLAFVHLSESGDRSFSFYRKPGADMMLKPEEIDTKIIETSKMFHYGSVSLTHEPSRSASLYAIEYAKSIGKLISYDVNLRPLLWSNLEEAKSIISDAIKYCDILKISDEELKFLEDHSDLDLGSKNLFERYGTKLILITLGNKGCFFRRGTDTGKAYAYDVPTIDTTGAGDAFLGGILYQILSKNTEIQNLTFDELNEMIHFSSALSSLVTTRNGALLSMPTLQEVNACMNKNSPLIHWH